MRSAESHPASDITFLKIPISKTKEVHEFLRGMSHAKSKVILDLDKPTKTKRKCSNRRYIQVTKQLEYCWTYDSIYIDFEAGVLFHYNTCYGLHRCVENDFYETLLRINETEKREQQLLDSLIQVHKVNAITRKCK